jgi:hypothetical protein
LGHVNLETTKRKPFDVLAEGLDFENSREFRGPVELFLASVAEWDGDVVELVMAA